MSPCNVPYSPSTTKAPEHASIRINHTVPSPHRHHPSSRRAVSPRMRLALARHSTQTDQIRLQLSQLDLRIERDQTPQSTFSSLLFHGRTRLPSVSDGWVMRNASAARPKRNRSGSSEGHKQGTTRRPSRGAVFSLLKSASRL